MNLIRLAVLALVGTLATAAHADNLVPNPDFDAGLDGWTQRGAGTVSLDDTFGDPNPPSLHLVGDTADGVSVVSGCIPIDDISGTEFRMHAGHAGDDTGGVVRATIEEFSDDACTTNINSVATQEFGGGFGVIVLSGLSRLSGVDSPRSVQIVLEAKGGTSGAVPDVHFDHIEFGPSGTLNPGGVPLGQEGLAGAWFNWDTSGQGFELSLDLPTFSPPAPVGSIFGAWYTFDTDAPSAGPEAQRWYSIQANLDTRSTITGVQIYRNVGGNFAAPPVTSAVQVGIGSLMFTSCTAGVFTYAFDDGRTGTIPLQNLLPNVDCSADGSSEIVASDFGYSGAWYDPTTSGQGFMITLNPVDAQAFVGWYTYAAAADGETQGDDGQRWFSAQDAYTVGSRSIDLTVYSTTGGVFDSANGTVTTAPVGTATLSFTDCYSATFDYAITAGAMSGRSGTIPLTRLGSAPLSCIFGD